MNHTSAYIHPRPGGDYWAMVRLPMDAKARPILGKGGVPRRYPDAYAALKAATENVCAYWNGHLVRDGATLLRHRQRAEALFGKEDA